MTSSRRTAGVSWTPGEVWALMQTIDAPAASCNKEAVPSSKVSVGWAAAIKNGCEEISMLVLMCPSFSKEHGPSPLSLTASNWGS